MSYVELMEKLRALPQEKRTELFDFLDYLVGRFGKDGNESWTGADFGEFSFSQAIQAIEDDPVTYTAADIRAPWQ